VVGTQMLELDLYDLQREVHMPEMSRSQQLVCRSAPWRFAAGRVVLPWALQGAALRGDVLEIGCGSGAMAAAILRRHPAVRLIATDYDKSMVDAARERLAPFGDRAEVRRADATELPFDAGAFDAALSFIMLHHVINWERALGELVRVLRPGGRLIGYDLLGDRGGRFTHDHEGDTRRMRQGELRQVLRGLPVEEPTVKPAFGGLVARFSLAKSAKEREGTH
jgi:ubiquinone/menaquinone biosynthesis C-methylase UbiE